MKAWAAALSRPFASLAATLFGLLLVTFLIGRVVPIDPALVAVGDRADAAAYAQARAELGLDDPLGLQFAGYLGRILRGDLGNSALTGRPVAEDLGRVFPATLELATAAIVLGVGFGLPLGVAAAVRRGRWVDHLVRVVGLLGYSVPVFWLGMVGLALFYARLDWVPGPGRLDVMFEALVPSVTGLLLVDAALAGEWDVWGDAARHLVLPAAVLGWFSLAYIARMTRSLMLAELGQEYVTAARAKGLSEARVVWVHALGNAAGPLVTVVALSYGGLLEGSVLTETVFAWPGIGRYLTGALLGADMNAVLGATVLVGAVFVGLNLVADLLQRWLDPRTR